MTACVTHHFNPFYSKDDSSVYGHTLLIILKAFIQFRWIGSYSNILLYYYWQFQIADEILDFSSLIEQFKMFKIKRLENKLLVASKNFWKKMSVSTLNKFHNFKTHVMTSWRNDCVRLNLSVFRWNLIDAIFN